MNAEEFLKDKGLKDCSMTHDRVGIPGVKVKQYIDLSELLDDYHQHAKREELGWAENLIALQDQYIKFMTDGYERAFSIASIHHYTESQGDIDKGEAFREALKAMRDKLKG